MTDKANADAHVVVRDDTDRRRYVVDVDGKEAGSIAYRLSGDRIVLVHTVIDDEYEGRGLGSRLASDALDDLRARGLHVVPRCPFIAAHIESHPQYADLVATDDDDTPAGPDA